MPSSKRRELDERVQIDHLSRGIGRYNLVVAVSKRARDLKERVDSLLIPSTGTLIKRALKEVSEGKVRIALSRAHEEEAQPKALEAEIEEETEDAEE